MSHFFEGLDIFKVLFNTAAEGLVVSNQQGKILLSNPRIAELFGYSEEELTKMIISDLIPMERKRHTTNIKKTTSKTRRNEVWVRT